MPRPYRPLAFANEFILKAAPDGLEHMKIQKLVYLAHGWWLAFDDVPILSESPQVWAHGPVFKSLYHILKVYGRDCICTVQKDNPLVDAPRIDATDKQALSLVDWVWKQYNDWSAYKLSDFTHQKGSPWQTIAEENNYQVPTDTIISPERIRAYFQILATQKGFAVSA